MTKFRTLFVGVMGILAFAAFASSASAAINLNRGNFTATARQTLTLDPGGLSIACDLSFAVSANTTIAATLPMAAPVNVGSVTAGSGGNCSGGATLTLLRLPWVLAARTSGGPGNVTGNTTLTIRNAQFLVGIGALSCLYAGDVSGTVNAAGTTLSVSSAVPFVSGLICPRPGNLSGTFTISPALVATLV